MSVPVTLWVQDLSVAAQRRPLLSGVSFRVRRGELHVLMGPNGSGKSTLAQALAGNPAFSVTNGTARLGRTNLLTKRPDERARLGLFVAFQQPLSIAGVPVAQFLRTVLAEGRGERLRPSKVEERAAGPLALVGLPPAVLSRELNVGFSGGEQKRFELAQLLTFGARFAVLDEIDSGLDVDGLRMVAQVLQSVTRLGTGVLFITHNPQVLRHLTPHAVHVLSGGRMVATGGPELAGRIAQDGFGSLLSSA